ncbi:Lar family restriction alleviation protein [Dielma fastidiosa]|uniref:Lar family restriction alleviation protein n=1 Tax=Dielma fastidiosa TaxID=1034346 RepID=UPI0023F0EB65|nr:Lar family restriction alleviation protein [Dielma fastidiosa]
MEQKLKHCPFCGGKAEIVKNYDHNMDAVCWVECTECSCRTEEDYIENEKEIVNTWNKRVML